MLEEEEIPVPINNDLERRIADIFDVFDHAGNKTVDVREISTIVRALGCCPTEAEIQEILVAIEDPETPGSVHLSNFLPYIAQIITEHKHQPSTPAQLLEAFQVLDTDGRGYLTKDVISMLMTQDGEPFTQDELDEMLEIAIDPHTQTVPYEYYINQLMHESAEQQNIYQLADKALEEHPPPPQRPTARKMSEFLQDLQAVTNISLT